MMMMMMMEVNNGLPGICICFFFVTELDAFSFTKSIESLKIFSCSLKMFAINQKISLY